MPRNTGEHFTKLVAASDKKKIYLYIVEFGYMEMFLCSFQVETTTRKIHKLYKKTHIIQGIGNQHVLRHIYPLKLKRDSSATNYLRSGDASWNFPMNIYMINQSCQCCG